MTTTTQPTEVAAAVDDLAVRVRRGAGGERPGPGRRPVHRGLLLARPHRVHLEHQDLRGPRRDHRACSQPRCPGCSRAAGQVTDGEEPAEAGGITEAWIDFETGRRPGHGHLRLRDGLCWTLLTTLYELKGYEEPQGPAPPDGRRARREPRPDDLAGRPRARGVRTGCHRAAVRADRRRRPGRHRARPPGSGSSACPRSSSTSAPARATSGAAGTSRLCLHDPVWYDHMPYLKFPDNWPVFSPKDKIADWLESYTKIMELNYWPNTEAKSATYNEASREWTVNVERDGQAMVLRPKQLVLATGMSGKPNIPSFPGMDSFRGDQHHSSAHPGPDAYQGKRCVVIGSNNSAFDICGALWENGADVTMVQRSSTHIVRSATLMDIGLSALYSEQAVAAGMTTEKADLIFASVPYRIMHLPDPAVRPDAGAGQGLLRPAREGRLRPRLGRRRLRPVHEVPAPRVRLLHRRRRRRPGGRTGTSSSSGARSTT